MPWIHDFACMYCKNLVIAWDGDDSKYGCLLRKIGNKFQEADLNYPNSEVNIIRGCDKFESSGMATRSEYVVFLKSQNPLTLSVPISSQVPDDGIVFEKHVEWNLPIEQRVRWDDITR